ncbi:MAG: S24/S26 family peptidase [Anaerolineales bacterium]
MPPWSAGNNRDCFHYISYNGHSMNPTLQDLDLLQIMPYGKPGVQSGDVIAFLPPNGETQVIHRVVRILPDGIRTRGDNSAIEDSFALQPSQITGFVVSAWRGQKRLHVLGGRIGRVMGYLARLSGALDRALSRLLGPFYRALARRTHLTRILPSSLRPRVVRFQADQRGQLRLLAGHRVIGYYDDDRRAWHIERPFRFFVDESMLPQERFLDHKRRVA